MEPTYLPLDVELVNKSKKGNQNDEGSGSFGPVVMVDLSIKEDGNASSHGGSMMAINRERANAHNLAQENGVNDFLPLGNLEKAVKEIVDQPLPLVDGIEDQLVEFSEAMRTVGKVLREAAEAKAAAQAEATEWKHKYEFGREKNMQLEQK
ncbi:unnamed protein product [Lactuca virosa]|uniref:Uncharacterized protein n=1 Tax=Lactuca virosa TaxID=75947 RepID=A0AAU9NCQ9_9ASTR|nr:unnamed protein product [Lactuca virosa]